MHFTLHLTRSCNMRCDYCYAPPRPDAGMRLETGVKALEMGAEMNRESTGIVFFGGEPLLHRDLIKELVGHSRKMEKEGKGRFHFKMTTNGTMLDGDFLEFSLREDVLVAMSIDGVAEAHDAHRKMADGSPTHAVVAEKLKLLLAARPYSSVLMVVNPDTARYLSDSVSYLMEMGAKYLIVSMNYAADWTEADFRALKRAYKKLGGLYVKWTREEKKFYLSPFEVKLSSHINRHCYQKERCELGKRQVSVGPDGSLYPCVQFTRAGRESEWRIGSVESGIDENVRNRIHAASQAEKDVCVKCAIKDRCNNTCGCLNWQTTGDINQISPVLCRHEQLLMPIADKVGDRLYKERNPLFLHKHYNAAYPVLSLLEDHLARKQRA